VSTRDGDSTQGRPADAALWWSVERTLRDVVLPHVADEWAEVATIQLVGLARYARTRPPDPAAARHRELGTVLDELAASANRLVAHHWPSGDNPVAATAALLTAAVHDDTPDGAAVQAALRPVVVRHLDEDLAASVVLMGPFRGQLPEDDAG
jgi:hypothetical protein